MEYFAKFTRHIATPRRAALGGSTSQLSKFEKAWKTVQNICYHQSKWRGIPIDKTVLPVQLVIMFDLLVQEDIRQSDTDDSTTGACMEYLLGNNILESLVQLAEKDQPVGIRGVVIRNLSTFVNLTDDKLLVQKAVHNPVLELLRSYAVQGSTGDMNTSQSVTSLFNTQQHIYDDDFVDLLYAICSKIRGEPMLLNIFFQDPKWLKSIEQRSISAESITAMMRSVESLRNEDTGRRGEPASTSYEFVLFSHLLQFVHLEGKAGDTARTSLLFLLELATTEIMASTGGNTALERFIIEDSGFAAILSATLGALYSQLPRSLRVSTGPAAVVPESFPSYSADLQNAIESSIFSADGARAASIDRWTEGGGSVSSANAEFRSRLLEFANLLGFIQEVLYRCPSSYVCNQLLKNLRENFLQAIMYPSLLESSDTDGSSVAVMRYLETMLQVARHEDLVSTIMDFLTDEGTGGNSHSFGQGELAPSQKRRRSTPDDSSPASNSTDSGCLPFTLRDLVYTNLQSTVSIDAVVSALNLLRLILSKHCRYSSRLIEVERPQPCGIKNGWMTNCTVAIDVHRQELDMYARLMTQLQHGDSSKRDGGVDSDSQVLRIPWRQDSLPKSELRPTVPESFSTGYDEYLEDAALDWDSHKAYHAELDVLFAAKNASKLSTQMNNLSLINTSIGIGIGQDKQHQMRPRKYSEAFMISANNTGAPISLPTNKLFSGAKAGAHRSLAAGAAGSRVVASAPCKRAKYNIKPSDPIVRALMNLLTKYFAQPRECNLALTGVLAALVGCQHRTLDLWLGFNLGALLGGVLSKPWSTWMDNLRNISDDESGSRASDSEGEDNPRGAPGFGGAPAAAIATANASKYAGLDRELQAAVRTLPNGATPPSLYLVISGLVQQARVLRNEIPDFSRRLKRARNALMGIVEDVNDLDGELENTGGVRSQDACDTSVHRGRDRGLSSASLENARVAGLSSAPSNPALLASAHRKRSPSNATASSLSAGVLSSGFSASRLRGSSISHASDMASNSSTSTGANNTLRSGSHMGSSGTVLGDDSMASSSWHALSVPPANANIAEFLENVIILQESIKEIIARVQVRRENGGDEDAVC